MIQGIDFSKWLQEELEKRQWSQSDLAHSAQISRAVVNKLLKGKTFPQPDTLKSIARAFKIPVETIYRAAGLLPPTPKANEFTAELVHKFRLIKNPKRRETALRLLTALIDEEENEKNSA